MVVEKRSSSGFKIIPNWIPAMVIKTVRWNIVYLLALKQNNNLVKQKIRFYESGFILLSKEPN
jgi:hypothetical protein